MDPDDQALSMTAYIAGAEVAISLLLSPAGCSAFTGGFTRVMTATPSDSTRYSAVGAILSQCLTGLRNRGHSVGAHCNGFEAEIWFSHVLTATIGGLSSCLLLPLVEVDSDELLTGCHNKQLRQAPESVATT